MGLESENRATETGGVGRESARENQSVGRIREYLYENTGIWYDDDNLYSLKLSLDERLDSLGLDSYGEYYRRLTGDSEEASEFVATVSVNKTSFFREPQQWDYFKNYLVSQLTSASIDPSRELKCWSAACSTGEEAYTASIVAQDVIRDLQSVGVPDVEVRVLGTDISRKALKLARTGRYRRIDLDPIRDYNPGCFYRYFDRVSEDRYRLTEQVRNNTAFRHFNLNTGEYPFENNFDVIFCRNVLIYFDRPMIGHVIEQLRTSLRPGGLLVLSRTEHLKGIEHSLTKVEPSVFRRPHE